MTNPAGSADIPATYIGTGNEPLSLCDPGVLPFFPAGALRNGRNASGSIFDRSATLTAFRIAAAAEYTFFVGMCGPSVALAMQWEGRLQGAGTSTMTLSNDEVQAGFIFGMGLTLTLDVNIDLWTPTVVWDGWETHIRASWNSLLNGSFEFTFDILSIIVDLLARIASARGFNRTEVAIAGIGGARPWGVFGSVENPFSAGTQRGGSSTTATVRPTLPIVLNIVQAVPQLRALAETISRVGVDLVVGPVLTLGFPVDLTLNSLRFSNGATTNTYTLAAVGGTSTGAFRATGPAPAANLQDITVTLTYRPGISFSLGFQAQLAFLSFFSFGGTIDLPFSFGFPIARPTSVDLTNRLGQSTLAMDGGCGCDEEIGELFDVEFAPLAS